jgi:tetratricopeptide (TPR) repeat protein
MAPGLAKQGGVASAAQLLAKAESLVDECQPELAIKFFQKAALLEPNNSEIQDAIGELATELDDPSTALEAFKRSIELAPKTNPGKWLYAAQLMEGEESEKYSLQGIACMVELLSSSTVGREKNMADDDANKLLKKQICDAFCSLAELYMTDLCDTNDAEAKCEHYLLEAMHYDLGLPEPTQAMANLRLTQQRKADSCECLDETVRRLNACGMLFRCVLSP